MVIGLDLFTEHFKEHTENYVLIGGSACDKNDLMEFIDVVKKEDPEIKELLKKQGITGVTLSDILDQIETTFKLTPIAS